MNEGNLIRDFTRGGQTTLHAVRMLGQVTKYLLALSFTFIVVFNISWLALNTSAFEQHCYVQYWLAQMHVQINNPNHLIGLQLQDGSNIAIEASDFIQHPNTKYLISSVHQTGRDGLKLSLLICLGFFLLALISLWYSGAKKRRNYHRRGSTLVDPKIVAKQLKQSKLNSPYQLSNVPLVKNTETKHILISGSSGTGKTVAMTELLDQIREKGQRAILYDKMGTFVRHYYRPGQDSILNPLDERCANWSLWSEGNKTTDFDTLAAALIPPPSPHADRIWSEASRSLFSVVAMKLQQQGRPRLADLLQYLQQTDLQSLAAFVKGTAAEPLITPEAAKFALSIIGTLSPALAPLRLLTHQDSLSTFSIRDWMANDKDNGWLFITSRADQHATLKPLISAWLEIATNALLSLPPNHHRRIWTVIDELPSLHKLPSLPAALAESRQFGGCMMLSIQTIAQLREIYGRDGAEALSGLCSTRLSFRTPDPATADWVSKALGSSETDETKEGFSYGASEIRDGVSLHQQTIVRPAVLPAEILSLADLTGYLRLPGQWPLTKVLFTPKNRLVISEAFQPIKDKKVCNPIAAKTIQEPASFSPSGQLTLESPNAID